MGDGHAGGNDPLSRVKRVGRHEGSPAESEGEERDGQAGRERGEMGTQEGAPAESHVRPGCD